jgi:hypothetical protein
MRALLSSTAEGGSVTASGAITALTEALTVPADVALTLSGASTFASGDYDVTVNGTLTLGGSTTQLAPEGNMTVNGTLTLSDGSSSITMATGKVLTLAETATASSGTGAIVAQGDVSGGTITIAGTAGYTTDPAGIVVNNFGAAVTAIMMTTATLTDKETIDLDATFNNNSGSIYGIGSIALTGNSATAIKDGANGSTGGAVNVESGVTLGGTLTGTAKSGKDASDFDDETDFALSLTSTTNVSIEDGDYNSATQKVGVIAFGGVQLKHSNLIGPVLAPFHIGVDTQR